jgi:xanthine dehydrogenase small subunit
MAAMPVRARACEAALRGGAWTAEAVARAQAALDAELAPITDMRASAAYRSLVARNLLRKFHLETGGEAGGPRVRTRILEPAEAP